MNYSRLLELPLYLGIAMLVIAGFMGVMLLFGDRWHGTAGILFNKRLRREVFDDYRSGKVALGGLLGLVVLLAKLGVGFIVLGGVIVLVIIATK